MKKPTVTVKDSNNATIAASDYTVTYSNNKNVGKATAKKKAFTVKWKKQATQTTGYQIQYSTSSKFASGNKYYSAWSAKKSVRTK